VRKKTNVKKAKPKGRKLTSKGQKLLNEISKVTAKNLEAGKYVKVVKVKVRDIKAEEAKKADTYRQTRRRKRLKLQQPQIMSHPKKSLK